MNESDRRWLVRFWGALILVAVVMGAIAIAVALQS
jgi:hypothetical protein